MSQDTGTDPETDAPSRGHFMQWEYYRLSVDGPNVETALQELGLNGWELVAVIPETRIFYGFQCFLKRPTGAANSPLTDRGSEARRLENLVTSRSNPVGRNNREGDSSESIPTMTWQR